MSTVEYIHHFHRSTGKSRYDTCNKFCRYKYRYSTIETKEPDRIGYNWFLFQHEYSGEGRGANSFVSIIMYLTCTIIVYLNRKQTQIT